MTPRIALVGEAPGRDEVRKGIPFIGESGQLLRSSLLQVGVDADRCLITNACDTMIPSPTHNDIKARQQELWHEVKSFGPRLILALGASSLYALTGRERILQERGRWICSEEFGWVFPTLHPAHILRNNDAFPDFAFDLEKFARGPVQWKDPEITVVGTLGEAFVWIDRLGCTKSYTNEEGTLFKSLGNLRVYDIETTSLKLGGEVLSIAIAYNDDRVVVFPQDILYNTYILRGLRKLFARKDIHWVGHNVTGFDELYLWDALEIKVHSTWDTMYMHYVTDERPGTHKLDTLAMTLLEAPDYKLKLDKKHPDMTYYEPWQVHNHVGMDCHVNMRLFKMFFPQVKELPKGRWLVQEVLMPAARALHEMEQVGCRLDTSYLRGVGLDYEKDIKKVTDEIHELSGNPFLNTRSPKQVASLLYDELKLPLYKATLADPIHTGKSRGERTTAAGALDFLEQHDKTGIVLRLKRIRKLEKIKGTYIDGLIARVGPDGRIRTEILLHGAETGRTSSINPNLQNIPKLIGMVIRNAFIATDGWKLIEGDYGQLELRTAAYLSRDKALAAALQPGKDIHREVAVNLYQVRPEEVTVTQRTLAKYINFGILYGRTADAVSEQMIASRQETHPDEYTVITPKMRKETFEEAKDIVKKWWETFHYLWEWTEQVRASVRDNGYVEVEPTGRRRRFPFITNKNAGEIMRSAVNFPIQSLAADICLNALVRIHHQLPKADGRIILTVHDSILVEAREGKVEKVKDLMKDLMTKPTLPLEDILPWTVDIASGDRWGDLVK